MSERQSQPPISEVLDRNRRHNQTIEAKADGFSNIEGWLLKEAQKLSFYKSEWEALVRSRKDLKGRRVTVSTRRFRAPNFLGKLKNPKSFTEGRICSSAAFKAFDDACEALGAKVVEVHGHPNIFVTVDFAPGG